MVDVFNAAVNTFGGMSFFLCVQYHVPKVVANVIWVRADMNHMAQMHATKLYTLRIVSNKLAGDVESYLNDI